MSTCNFKHDDVLGIIALNVWDYIESEVDYHKNEEGIENYDESDVDFYWFYEDWGYDIEELNKQLNVLEVSLESGYYESAQLHVSYYNKNALYDEDLGRLIASRNDKNELSRVCKDIECRYWDISPSEIFKDYDVVVNWINERLKYGSLLNLGVVGVFSNGEAVYEKSNELLEA